MLPLLTAENRARLPTPSPAPPARLRPPRSSRRNWEEFAAEALHTGAGPAGGAAGVAEAFVRGRGKEDRETQMTTVGWAKRAKGNEKASPKARESRSGTRNFPAGEGVPWGKSRRFWVRFCEPLGRRLCGLRAGSELTSQHLCALNLALPWKRGKGALQTGLVRSSPSDQRRLFFGVEWPKRRLSPHPEEGTLRGGGGVGRKEDTPEAHGAAHTGLSGTSAPRPTRTGHGQTGHTSLTPPPPAARTLHAHPHRTSSLNLTITATHCAHTAGTSASTHT